MTSYNINPLALSQKHFVLARAGILLPPLRLVDEDEKAPWYVIPSNTSPGIGIAFTAAGQVDCTKALTWADSIHIEPETRIRHTERRQKEKMVLSGWTGLVELYCNNRIAFDRMLRSDNEVSALWASLLGKDPAGNRIAWDPPAEKEQDFECPYSYPPEKDVATGVRFNEADYAKTDKERIRCPWGNPPAQDRYHTTRWGKRWYEEICLRDYVYPQGDALNFDIETPIVHVGDGDHIDFWFDSLSYDLRCNHQEPSGWRDPYTYRPPVIIPQTPQRRCHLHMNSALLKRVADNMPLDLLEFSAKIDFDSFVWKFSATLNSRESFEAVEPSEAGYTEVEAAINGYLFRFYVEEASCDESRRKSFAIEGRGLAAALADPFAAQVSYTEEQPRTARQLMEDRLFGSGWTLDWQITDFLVPADAYSFHNLTPMAAIADITNQVGARIQAHRLNKVLQILPRYVEPPWQWASATPALALGESVILTSARNWQPGPDYNGVVVSGTTQGVIAKVMRTGSGGTNMAPMVAEPLMVTTEAVTMRGIYELARWGKWQPGTLNLPLEAGPEQPQLLLPGTLLQVNRAQAQFPVQTTGVQVSARRQNGLKVRQYVEVERYRGEPVA
jgi:hypothetical protein